MKTAFLHRRCMAYIALVALVYLAYGLVSGDMNDSAIGAVSGLSIALAGIIGAYMTNATYNDHSERVNHDNK